jgi:hypothetical protein
MRHDDEVADVRRAQEKESILVVGMIWIEPGDREW